MDWTIAFGAHAAAIDGGGGGLRCYQVDGVSLIDDYPEGTRPPGGAGQILAPWPNRIRDGRYTFNGRTHELALTEPDHGNAIHGLVRRLPWTLVHRSESAVTVGREIDDEPGYPFRLRLTTTWSLGTAGLHAEHAAENIGPEPAPFGMGVHPYLWPTGPVDAATLTIPADEVVLSDDRGLPIEVVAVTGTDLDFRSGRRIGAQQLDHAFRLTGDTVRLGSLQLWVSDAFPWVQVFTGDTLAPPRRRRAVAVEPMTCPADAFNTGTDLVTLEPGEAWRGDWRLGDCRRS